MSLTNDQLKALSFGYLTGKDLMRWCAPQLLNTQLIKDSDCLQDGCTIAYDELRGKLSTTYDLTGELAKDGSAVPDTRAQLIVKIASIWAVRNVLGNAQAIGEDMNNNFIWADKTVKEIRQSQNSAPAVPEAGTTTMASTASLIDSSFNMLG